MIKYAIFLISLGYFGLLSSHDYTWLFVSQDSGDWLAASIDWFVPQPMGSPLFILLGHFLNLFPGSLIIKMTVLLSALPSAITVTLTYLIAKRLTQNTPLSMCASLVLLGATVFLTQSTILEEYAIATMLLVLSYWYYINDKKKLCLLSMGLGTAIHIMVLGFALLWLFIERRNWRTWLKHSWVFIISGPAFYLMIPIMMLLKTPPYLAGYFGWDSLYNYIFGASGAVAFQISIYDFPKRIGFVLAFLLVSLGFAFIPAILGISRGDNKIKIMLITIGWSIVYYLFCCDPSTWTFLTFGMPFMAVLAMIGLQKLNINYQKAVAIGAVALIICNAFLLNAGHLAKAEPVAADVKEAMMAVPDGSAVVVIGGSFSLCTMYCRAEGKDIIPIVWRIDARDFPELEDLNQQQLDLCTYLYEPRGIESKLQEDIVVEMLNEGWDVYVATYDWMMDMAKDTGSPTWTAFQDAVELEGEGMVRRIVSIDESQLVIPDETDNGLGTAE